jgi:hypothetical protein
VVLAGCTLHLTDNGGSNYGAKCTNVLGRLVPTVLERNERIFGLELRIKNGRVISLNQPYPR